MKRPTLDIPKYSVRNAGPRSNVAIANHDPATTTYAAPAPSSGRPRTRDHPRVHASHANKTSIGSTTAIGPFVNVPNAAATAAIHNARRSPSRTAKYDQKKATVMKNINAGAIIARRESTIISRLVPTASAAVTPAAKP